MKIVEIPQGRETRGSLKNLEASKRPSRLDCKGKVRPLGKFSMHMSDYHHVHQSACLHHANKDEEAIYQICLKNSRRLTWSPAFLFQGRCSEPEEWTPLQ